MSKQLRLALLPCACLAVLFCAEVQPKAQADTDQPTFLVYGYQDLLDLIGEGGSVAADGEYTVWIKAREGSGCQVSIGKVDFSTHSKGNGTTYSWEKAGTVNLKAGEHFHLRLDVSRPLVGQEAGQDIAQMVLTQDPGANPERIDEISLVFPDRLSPPHDRRLWDIRHLNRYYTWPGYESKEEWQRRAEDLREHIKVSCGLWPEPDRCPLNARIFGRIERDGYSIEKVFFESYPGFFVTGNLYRPLGKEGPFPAIASPHGHWGEGRLADKESGSVPGRCINFARQGYIIFHQGKEEATPDFTPLVPDEKVLLRATGHFEVSGMRRYFVEIIAAFSTLETREHVVMGWIPPSRFLLLASWPKAEVGMWYIFFKPEAIREIAVGEVHFGLRARPAIRINYRRDKGGEETLYLSFDDTLQRRRVLEDLRRDAPYLA